MNSVSSIDFEELKKIYQGEDLDIILNKIKNGYPVQYAIGNVDFYGNRIIVNENVLIPRFETEFLVDYIYKSLDKDKNYNIFEIGVGSGCISISLAKLFQNSNITGIDISKNAINVANINKKENSVDNITFINNDLFCMENFGNYNVIVSNPPYVGYNEEVGIETKYEPQNAIFADDHGLIFYKKIIDLVSASRSVEHVFFEIGMNQAELIKAYSNDKLNNYTCEIKQDLANKDRYIHIFLNK